MLYFRSSRIVSLLILSFNVTLLMALNTFISFVRINLLAFEVSALVATAYVSTDLTYKYGLYSVYLCVCYARLYPERLRIS